MASRRGDWGDHVKKALALPMLVVGVVLVAIGAYAFNAGRDGKDLVETQLVAKQVVTPADASIPNVVVHDADTALAMSAWVDSTISKATGGRSYDKIGAYLTAEGTETADVTKAAVVNGVPQANPLRQIAFEASVGTTGLGMSALAMKVADIAILLGVLMALVGLALTGTGLAFAGVHVPAFAKRIHIPHPHLHHA